MKEDPLITIILAAFNASRFIQEAIDSVLLQTYKKWELIIVNDGSTDDTEAVVKLNTDPRILYCKQENGGVSSARNVGLQRMSGEYFCFLDADDVLPVNSLESRMRKFAENPELEFVDGVVHVVDESLGRTLRTYNPGFSGRPLKKLFRLDGRCFVGCSWMIRRKPKSYQFTEGLNHGEDLYFYLTLARDGGRYDHVSEEILYYRRRAGSAMHDVTGLQAGYKQIYRQLVSWPEFALIDRIIYNFKFRKSIFLSYIAKKNYLKAFSALVS